MSTLRRDNFVKLVTQIRKDYVKAAWTRLLKDVVEGPTFAWPSYAKIGPLYQKLKPATFPFSSIISSRFP